MEYIVLGVAVIILILIFSQFRPSSTQKIKENLYVVRCGIVNFYVYKTDNGAILFDTGISKSFVKRGLIKLGISPETVTHIFLTHTDYDHMGGILAFIGSSIIMANPLSFSAEIFPPCAVTLIFAIDKPRPLPLDGLLLASSPL